LNSTRILLNFTKYSTIFLNVPGSSQFKERGYDIDSLGFEYDLESMMHYAPWAFSNGNGPTIEPLDKSKKIADNGGFSKIDLAQLNALYWYF